MRTDRRELPSIPPVGRAPQADAIAAAEDRGRLARNQRIRWALFALLPIVAAAGAWYVTGGRVMSTDDAYVEADKVGISTYVSGIVQDVDVRDNQRVTAGQILYRLDPRQFQIALDNAKANLALTALAIESMKRDYQRMLSDIEAAQAQVKLDQVTFNRYAKLLKGIIITPAPLVFEDLRSGALVPILSDFLPKQFSIDALYPHREHVPAKVRTFIDLLVKNFRQIEWVPCAYESRPSGNSIMKVISSSAPRVAPKQPTPDS
jgi:hypothetical protein